MIKTQKKLERLGKKRQAELDKLTKEKESIKKKELELLQEIYKDIGEFIYKNYFNDELTYNENIETLANFLDRNYTTQKKLQNNDSQNQEKSLQNNTEEQEYGDDF